MHKKSPLDTLLNEIQHGLNTCFVKPTSQRSYPAAQNTAKNKLTEEQKKHSAALMRINNAGEVAAQGLYRGQSLTAKSQKVRDNMLVASAEENDHLNWCQRRLGELKGERSLLDPIWYVGSLKIGIIAGLFGDQWSLGFVEETEKQVSRHLTEHLESLPEGDQHSKAIIEQMKQDEEQHAQAAHQAGAAALPQPIQYTMSLVSKIMTRSSYHI